MKSPRHPVMQAAEPFSDPAGTHCAGATDGANVIVMEQTLLLNSIRLKRKQKKIARGMSLFI